MSDAPEPGTDPARESGTGSGAATPAVPDATRSAPETARAPAPARGRRGAGVLAFLALLVALVALAGVAWPYWLLYQGRDPLVALDSPRLERAEARIDSLQSELDRARSAARDAVDAKTALDAEVATLRRAFTDLSAEVASDSPLDERQWRIAEVAYLLRVANLRARMEGDRDGAESLLQAADKLLVELDDPGLYSVRKALAAALAALRAQPVFDRVGMYLELEQLGDRVANMPLDLPVFEREAPAQPADAGVVAWLRATFAGLFDFRVHRGARVQPLMAPDEAVYLHHNLQLKLEQAQLALLRGDQAVWKDALHEARGWVQTYFDARDPQTDALDRALGRLEAERIDVEPPDISAPLTELLRLRGRGEIGADAAPAAGAERGK